MSIGLCGAHRTGKTTLAEALSIQVKKPFVKTITSEIFRQYGLDPAHPLDFRKRLEIQKQILISYAEIWASQQQSFITDRTPVDLMAYTLADVQGSTEVNFPELERYMEQCFEVTNKYFNVLIVLQPGIELIPAEGKAALNQAYIEHLNSLVLGLCHDERLKSSIVCIKREVIDLDDRIKKVLNIQ
jgi:hypothetical protein